MSPRLSAGVLAGALLASGTVPGDVVAQAWPVKPVQVVTGYPPGGSADILSRLLARGISESTGQNALVDNRPGASGVLSLERVTRSAPDGHTLLVMASSSATAQVLNPRQTLDIERDLAPLGLAAVQPVVLAVHPGLAAGNIREFLAMARARPGAINYGSSGVGGASHLAGELFNAMADVRLFHVPFKGGSPSVAAAAAGEIQALFTSITSAKPLLESGRLRPLAVTSRGPSALLPGVPSLNETVAPGFESVVWYGVLGPASLPDATAAAVNALLVRVVGDPRMKQPFFSEGMEPTTSTIPEFRTMIRTELVQSARIIKLAGIKTE